MSEIFDYYKTIKHLRISKHNDCVRERGIRLYCLQCNTAAWSLQLRAPLGKGPLGHADSKDFVIAAANLGRDELLDLRSAIDQALSEFDASVEEVCAV